MALLLALQERRESEEESEERRWGVFFPGEVVGRRDGGEESGEDGGEDGGEWDFVGPAYNLDPPWSGFRDETLTEEERDWLALTGEPRLVPWWQEERSALRLTWARAAPRLLDLGTPSSLEVWERGRRVFSPSLPPLPPLAPLDLGTPSSSSDTGFASLPCHRVGMARWDGRLAKWALRKVAARSTGPSQSRMDEID